jgi:ABC-type uncharacterized transport system permease subunit
MPKALRVIVNIIRVLALLIAVYIVVFTAANDGWEPDDMEPSTLLFGLFIVAVSVALSPTLWTTRFGNAQQTASRPAYGAAAPSEPAQYAAAQGQSYGQQPAAQHGPGQRP